MIRQLSGVVFGISLLSACTDPTGMAPIASRDLAPPARAASAGVVKSAITGTISFVGGGAPEKVTTTPSGQCFFRHAPVYDHLDGDVVGSVTFDEDERAACDFSHLTAAGPFTGQVAWNGRSGTISGQWETNCVADASQPIGLSCDGTMNARGSGGLDGVQFHFKWGPGWYPFPYTGTAFSS
jgi:hypothetical protein